jgi:hypothetical protein
MHRWKETQESANLAMDPGLVPRVSNNNDS